ARSTYLSEEAIKEIKDLSGKDPNIIHAMAKKYHISPSRVKEYMENRERKQQVRYQNADNFWDKEIESIYDLYSELPY
ncbi:5492_t:CDS:1, partial [Ambispora gerdemannii]